MTDPVQDDRIREALYQTFLAAQAALGALQAAIADACFHGDPVLPQAEALVARLTGDDLLEDAALAAVHEVMDSLPVLLETEVWTDYVDDQHNMSGPAPVECVSDQGRCLKALDAGLRDLSDTITKAQCEVKARKFAAALR